MQGIAARPSPYRHSYKGSTLRTSSTSPHIIFATYQQHPCNLPVSSLSTRFQCPAHLLSLYAQTLSVVMPMPSW
jgi:hypothetical protein